MFFRLNNQNSRNQNLKNLENHKLTEYFPVRRSVRKTKTTVLEEKQRTLEQAIRNKIEEGLEVILLSEKSKMYFYYNCFLRLKFLRVKEEV